MIYVPTSLENNNYCYVKIDTNIIREYKTTSVDSYNDYTDFNTGNHYDSYNGKEYITTPLECLDHNSLTNEFYYRNDFAHICVIICFLSFFILYLPIRLLLRFYKRGMY